MTAAVGTIIELETRDGAIVGVFDRMADELLVVGMLVGTLEPGRWELGWLKPGKPPELRINDSLVGIAVEAADDTALSSSGEYVNEGIR